MLAAATHPRTPTWTEQAAVGARREFLTTRPVVAEELRKAGADGEVESLHPRQRSIRGVIADASFCMWRLDRWRQLRPMHWQRAVGEAVSASLPTAFDFSGFLTSRRAPVTVIQGDQDYLFPAISSWRELAEIADAVEVEVITGAGHQLWTDDPDAFTTALDRGLKRIERE